MKKAIIIATILACAGFINASAQDLTLDNGVVVKNASITRDRSGMHVNMDLDLSGVNVKTNRGVKVSPTIINGKDTVSCASLVVYGRNRYYYYIRNDKPLTENEADKAFRKNDAPDTFQYADSFKYDKWMDGARLFVNEKEFGCCNKLIKDDTKGPLAVYTNPAAILYYPQFIFVHPKAELVKARSLKRTAYIDFPVSQTVIYPSYRRNTTELSKIHESIDSLKSDSDITVNYLTLKGFASPESPYSNNTRLAKGRVEALKNYLLNYPQIPADSIRTDYEPENWEGLRKFVEASDITNKQGILNIIDSNREPDNKEAYLKKTYPVEYKYLLEECYPGLRRTDYAIGYVIRGYESIDDIRRVYAKSPEKLSSEEFFMLAESYSQDTPEFKDVIMTAVNFYPKDPVANLNAANIAMKEGRMSDAGKYLDKAGDSYDAIYTRGVYNAVIGDNERAKIYFSRVASELPQAAQAIKTLDAIEAQRHLFE
ncbi:MAG: DUF3868 domain-containing protein [Bacteroidales bacterium]|nr:DUF3868 domain-containing protein [Candidatus Cryptobacteroides equifaecalis]